MIFRHPVQRSPVRSAASSKKATSNVWVAESSSPSTSPPVEIPEDVAHSENAKAEAAELAVSSRFVHMLSWLSLAMTATVLFLILKQGPPLAVHTDPAAAARIAEKMAQLHLTIQSNQRHIRNP